MKDLRLNETPLRTSVNFGINDIVIKDIEIPQISGIFQNLQIENDSKNIKIYQNSNFNESNFVYSIGKEIEDINNNSKVEIVLNENQIKEQVKLNYLLDDNNNTLVDSIKIDAKANSKGTIILKYDSLEKNQCFVNTKLRIIAEEKSSVQVIILNMINDSSNNFLAIESELAKEANLNVIIIDFGGKTSVSNYYSKLKEESSISTIDTIYLGDNERLIDINYIVHLIGGKTNVNIEVQGALKDNAKKNFKGTIDFKKGSKKSKGNENEFCMLLSPNAKSKALPMLLCTEDDVEGNHSTASGNVNKAELFYLMSRGIPQKEAMKLLVRAKFTPIIEKIDDEEIKKEIINQIDIKLN